MENTDLTYFIATGNPYEHMNQQRRKLLSGEIQTA